MAAKVTHRNQWRMRIGMAISQQTWELIVRVDHLRWGIMLETKYQTDSPNVSSD